LEVIDTKVCNMLLKLQSLVDCGEGTLGWPSPNFMTIDMQLFGVSTNVDTSKGEDGLKIWAKLPSHTTQTTHGTNKSIEQVLWSPKEGGKQGWGLCFCPNVLGQVWGSNIPCFS
jgi:hypothetical protein